MNVAANKSVSDKITAVPRTKSIAATSMKPCAEDSSESEMQEALRFLDKLYQANIAKLTNGISPAAVGTACYSWLSQLALCPGLLCELAFFPAIHPNECIKTIFGTICADDENKDVRFHKDDWQYIPWRWYAEGFLQVENWWQHATNGVPGLPAHVERTVSFWARQVLDALSPSNFVMTNPELFYETIRSGGQNLVRGTEIAVEDILERWTGTPPAGAENFIPGKQVAVTPGKVIYRNHLIELIQYEARTSTVCKEPVLIVPAWIMKYYILDLSPENSLVKWLVEQGHTVFIISWRNPDNKDRDLGMDDYYRLGAMAAIDAVSRVFPETKIHLLGYCLGGTLAIITAATMARDGDKRLKSLSLLAAQGDFTEAGELMLFASESEIAFLKNMMWEKGYLDTKHMAGSFQMLRTYDLIWSKIVHDYLHGVRRGMIDLLAWNADATRMPYKMHSEYLEKLFLRNEFAEGHYKVEGKPVVAENIKVPVFVVGTEKDHVAPWKSVYKIHLMTNSSAITFVLTNGGHNAGILSEPGHEGRSYRIHVHKKDDAFIHPDNWLNIAEKKNGSWWHALHGWLVAQSAKKSVEPPTLSSSLPDAPGTYVMQK
ncbi:alpha/beta fold hydrolase [Legionella spiritensis]|uniref:alpha/beta fold hydrolase n=1 Tax=Legionella spiritensis TaxID=452 RepID=UPI000F6D7F11|nr:alpha/beta fold hydrolase [Legionella spiritensis]VEG92014.1 putative Poly-beta-hydroxybutyrate polymerase [Legionella spiritensis]